MEIDSLRNVPRRRKIHDAAMHIKLPGEVKKVLEEIAVREGVTASTVIRWAVADYLKKEEDQ